MIEDLSLECDDLEDDWVALGLYDEVRDEWEEAFAMTRVDATCTCGHALAYHDAALTPRGECAIGGCGCKKFEEAKEEAGERREARDESQEDPEEDPVEERLA